MNSLEPGLRRHPAEVWKDLGEMGSCAAAGVCSQADLPFPFPVVWSMPPNAGAPTHQGLTTGHVKSWVF